MSPELPSSCELGVVALDSYEFKDTLTSFFSNDQQATDLLTQVDWKTWFHSPGYPPKPNFDDTMVKVCYELADRWRNKAKQEFTAQAKDIEGWVGNQSVVFLEALQSSAPLRPEDILRGESSFED